jgi:hypothetical protein
MTPKSILIIACMPLLLIGCNSNETSSETNHRSEESERPNTEAKKSVDSPCELVSLADVRGMFSVPEELAIDMDDRVLTFPTCSFEWEDGKVITTMKVGDNEVKVQRPSTVMIVMVKGASESMYNTSTKVYKDIEELSGLGSMASWGNQMSQLTFLAGNHLFHVHVKVSTDDAANKA